METKKRADVSQVEQEDGGESRHVENSLLSEIGGSKGARESSRDVGSKRLRIQLDSSNNLFFLYCVYCLFFA